ncbi:hypothetical protein BC833DRAFT_613258 [Globomyces pollinis-pini]|nr:hypothetical protein BC833DRAFT_613258 [Globomyces pollinis-pini]
MENIFHFYLDNCGGWVGPYKYINNIPLFSNQKTKMSNAEHYLCDGSQCEKLAHKPLIMSSFDWSKMLDKKGNHATIESLANIVIVFISKGWCKYCCRISPNLDKIQDFNTNEFSLVIQNHSFIEKPYQEEGFKQFMEGKSFFNMNYIPESDEELKAFRLFLRDHSIEFPALFVFDRNSGKVITNDGYNAIKSVFDLKKDASEFHQCQMCPEEFRVNVLAKWQEMARKL